MSIDCILLCCNCMLINIFIYKKNSIWNILGPSKAPMTTAVTNSSLRA